MNSEKLEKDFVSSKVIGKHRSPFVIVSERAFCDLRRGKSETMLFVRLFKIGDLRKANTSFVKSKFIIFKKGNSEICTCVDSMNQCISYVKEKLRR